MEYVRRVLIVDDEPRYATILLRHLKREGFRTDSASGSNEVYQKIEKAHSQRASFDLVIMNTALASSNDFGLLDWIHQNHPIISVIFISPFAETDELMGKIRPAMDDYGNKPLTPQRMMELIDSVERKRKCTHVRMRKGLEPEAISLEPGADA